MEGGDAGGLLKTNEFFPYVDFIRSPFSGRQANSIQHSDVPSVGSAKVMKTSVLTTGFLVAYTNSFDVKVFNIQKPSKETCTQDYSQEYFTRIVLQRRVNAQQKKNDKSLASLIKQINNGGVEAKRGNTPGGSNPAQTPAQEEDQGVAGA